MEGCGRSVEGPRILRSCLWSRNVSYSVLCYHVSGNKVEYPRLAKCHLVLLLQGCVLDACVTRAGRVVLVFVFLCLGEFCCWGGSLHCWCVWSFVLEAWGLDGLSHSILGRVGPFFFSLLLGSFVVCCSFLVAVGGCHVMNKLCNGERGGSSVLIAAFSITFSLL